MVPAVLDSVVEVDMIVEPLETSLELIIAVVCSDGLEVSLDNPLVSPVVPVLLVGLFSSVVPALPVIESLVVTAGALCISVFSLHA